MVVAIVLLALVAVVAAGALALVRLADRTGPGTVEALARADHPVREAATGLASDRADLARSLDRLVDPSRPDARAPTEGRATPPGRYHGVREA